MVQKMLTSVHKTQRMAFALTLLERYHKDGNEFLYHIIRVTSNEARVSFVNVETKEHSKQWIHNHSTKEPKISNKRFLPARKLMATVLWDRRGVLMVEFIQKGTTLTSEKYCETVKTG
jgi:hypothetical protein